MFIIDLDDVLLDTHAYKEARVTALAKLGVSREVYEATYQEAYCGYTHERHAQLLARQGFSYETVLRRMDECLRRIGDFIFSDTIQFLDFLKTYHQPLILLSMGVAAIQEFKLKMLGIQHYFDRICTTVESKEKVLLMLGDFVKKDAWFFEDKVAASQAVKKAFPYLRIVLKQGAHIPLADYKRSGFPYFKTLSEIQEYVREHGA